MPTYEELGFGRGAALTGDRAKSVFGQVMGLVAVTMAFAAGGAYIARNMSGGSWIIFFVILMACSVGLNAAAARGNNSLAMTLLFVYGLTFGMFLGPVIHLYLKADPDVVYKAAGATGLLVAALGAIGYSTQRDLSGFLKPLMWVFAAIFIVGLVAILASVSSLYLVYLIGVLILMSGYVMIYFNILARSGDYQMAVPIAAAIFAAIMNIFLVLLQLFGGSNSRR